MHDGFKKLINEEKIKLIPSRAVARWGLGRL